MNGDIGEPKKSPRVARRPRGNVVARRTAAVVDGEDYVDVVTTPPPSPAKPKPVAKARTRAKPRAKSPARTKRALRDKPPTAPAAPKAARTRVVGPRRALFDKEDAHREPEPEPELEPEPEPEPEPQPHDTWTAPNSEAEAMRDMINTVRGKFNRDGCILAIAIACLAFVLFIIGSFNPLIGISLQRFILDYAEGMDSHVEVAANTT